MRTLGLGFVLVAASALFACSATKDTSGGDLGGADGSTDEDGGIHLDDGGGLNGEVNGEGGTPVTLGCSGDLQNVTDDKGVVQQKCPSDQGCFGGACIPACEAAAKSKGNVGCTFLTPTPSFYTGITPPCFAVFVANNWSKVVKINVQRGGASYDATAFARIPSGPDATTWPKLPAAGLDPGKVAVLFLSSDPGSTNAGFSLKCPVAQAVPGGTAVSGSGKGTAWSITTDVPVSAYDILPYGGARSFLPAAELLLPTSAWGTNYVSAVPPQEGMGGPLWGQVVAAENGTTVKINPTINLPGAGGAPAATKGAVTTFTLNAGEYVQWQGSGLEMSGSVISSDKPVSFVGGTGYLCLTSKTSPSGGGCDSGHQMVPPISALGSEYVAAPYVTRRADLAEESIRYRIVGTVDGTKLTYDPPVAGAPTSLSRGTVSNFEATGVFVVKSQDKDHPFYVAQMMAGSNLSAGSRPGATVSLGFGGENLGDEEFVNLLPPAQFLTKYVFFTDPTYSTTNLVLTRVKTPAGFKDVKVDCLGTISGWKPAGGSGNYEYVGVDLVRSMMGVGSCTNGQHVAQSDGQFGLMVWGTDTFSSYAYPGGGNVGTINTVVVDPLPK